MTNEELISRARRVAEMDALERNRYGKAMAPAQSHAHLLLVQLADALEALTVATGAATQTINCDYCGDALPSVKSMAHVPTTPSIQRLGFDTDKIVCPECVKRARDAAPLQVDEAKLAEIIAAHSYDELTGEGHKLDQDKVCSECGWVIRVAGEHNSPTAQAKRKYGHIAYKVNEWLRGGAQ